MAHLKFKAFMSCSFSESDSSIADFFKSYLESFGLDVFKYDFQEPNPLTESIKNHIKESDCLVAIMTRRDRLDSGEWVCANWIQHEIIYANAVGIPIVIFAEEDVKIDGLIKLEERYQRFSRDAAKLLLQVPRFNKFLIALYQLLEERFKMGDVPSPDLYYVSIKTRDEFINLKTWVTTCEFEVESFTDALQQTVEGLGDVDWLRHPFEVVKDFEFSVLNSPKGVSVNCVPGRSKEDPNQMKVRFDPALKTNERVCYAYRYSADQIRPLTIEAARKVIEEGDYWSNNPLCTINMDLFDPTGLLISEVLFPRKYPVYLPDYVVESRESNALNMQEMNRIREIGGFKILRLFDRLTLTLTVPKPLIGHRYRITWQPPSESELVQLGLAQ